MPSKNVKSSEFNSIVNINEVVVVDFWAEWCDPCKQFSLVYEKIADNYPQIEFVKINIEQELPLVELFEVRSIPHLMIFKKGIVIYSNAGSMPASTLQELIEQAIIVDVKKICS